MIAASAEQFRQICGTYPQSLASGLVKHLLGLDRTLQSLLNRDALVRLLGGLSTLVGHDESLLDRNSVRLLLCLLLCISHLVVDTRSLLVVLVVAGTILSISLSLSLTLISSSLWLPLLSDFLEAHALASPSAVLERARPSSSWLLLSSRVH